MFNKQESNDNFSLSLLDQTVREKRLEPNQNFNLQIFVNDILVSLKNISDSGLSFSTSEELKENLSAVAKIQFSSAQSILLEGKVIWKREREGQWLYGFHFNHRYLPEGLLEAVDRIQLMSNEVGFRLEQFSRLDEDFKKLTFEIKYYLEFVKEKLDQLENDILVTSQNVRNSYRDVLKSNFENEFVTQLKKYSKSLDTLFVNFKEKEKKEMHIQFFRSNVGVYYTQNPFIGRALRKPRGYAGDYEMMNQIYRDNFEGRNFFEMLMHSYGINESSSLSVKYRRNYFVENIFELSKGKTEFKICSVACGPAKETIDFLKKVPVDQSEMYHFYLLDQDVEALLNAKRNILEVIIDRDLKTRVDFFPVSVKDILESTEEIKRFSQVGFDFIYTAGLYDYLTQPVAKMLTAGLLQWLKPASKMIIGNFHPANPTKTISELVADWKLIHRNEEQMLDLVSEQRVRKVNLHKDPQEIDLFIEIEV